MSGRKRFVSTEISSDREVNRLAREHGDFAALLYTWLIPQAEDDATVKGDAEEIALKVIPGLGKSPQQVQDALDGMVQGGLLERHAGMYRFPPSRFYAYQTYVKEERRALDYQIHPGNTGSISDVPGKTQNAGTGGKGRHRGRSEASLLPARVANDPENDPESAVPEKQLLTSQSLLTPISGSIQEYRGRSTGEHQVPGTEKHRTPSTRITSSTGTSLSLTGTNRPHARGGARGESSKNGASGAKLKDVIDLVRAAGGHIDVNGGRDGRAVKDCFASAALIAEAYMAVWRDEWPPNDKGWMKNNLTIPMLVSRIPAYTAWKASRQQQQRNGSAPAFQKAVAPEREVSAAASTDARRRTEDAMKRRTEQAHANPG